MTAAGNADYVKPMMRPEYRSADLAVAAYVLARMMADPDMDGENYDVIYRTLDLVLTRRCAP